MAYSGGHRIYIVTSYCGTVASKLIRNRAKLKFWNRYLGDGYSHVSLSLNDTLDDMLSFARIKLHNPLVAGLVRENIRTDVFAFHPKHAKIAVFEIPVTIEQYNGIKESMEFAWRNRNKLKYNFLGLCSMLITGRGVARQNHYLCSQWVSEVLIYNGISLFGDKKPVHIRPFDMYIALKDYMVFEGYITSYPLYYRNVKKENDYAGASHAPIIL